MLISDGYGQVFELPTPEEDAAIARGIAADPDAAPEMDEAWFCKARRGRPLALQPKAAVNIRLDQDILDHFRASGKGWQTRMNAVLRDWMQRDAG